jgi:YD repeat-containing protein
MQDDKTPNGWPLPHPENLLDEDVLRLRTALIAADGEIRAVREVAVSKEPAIKSGTVEQYMRGDKQWANLSKQAVGLGNVDNTADMEKPVSTFQGAAIADAIKTANALPVVITITSTNGRITKVTEDGVATTMTYNADGTVATVSYPHGGKTRTETYTYSAGQITGMTATEA